MRGSLDVARPFVAARGIIPAHAGLTLCLFKAATISGDHPRACGAHPLMTSSEFLEKGSSPRMRGSLFRNGDILHITGIIPAHAGLTIIYLNTFSIFRDHPRACGAHSYVLMPMLKFVGSSPRMRGSLDDLLDDGVDEGIIPAHAGLTEHRRRQSTAAWDHPRACGAHVCILADVNRLVGSSPRMRGSPRRGICTPSSVGIIPAHAGLTGLRRLLQNKNRDHPRACGAHSFSMTGAMFEMGSSPRMRGSPGPGGSQRAQSGIIPAHAGLTNRKRGSS